MHLYRWIQPRHLDAPVASYDEAIKLFQGIERYTSPTEKLVCAIEAIKRIYMLIGEESGNDKLFPCVVFCLIRSNLKHLYLHVKLMQIYRTRRYGICSRACKHGVKIDIVCECYRYLGIGLSEAEYYLTTLRGAVEFIEKLEFYSLTITEEEFVDYVAINK